MNASKILISCTAALAVVGAIGLANAQSTGTTTPAAPGRQLDNTTVPATQDSAGTATGTTMNNTATPAGTANTELAAQADRN